MTQAAVANAAGVSRAWLIELEAGKPTSSSDEF
jgi:DNA-binding XRE family transcriptional regulator